ncbi:Putative glycosyltransferase EpsE [Clostridiales bacterium CHKCI001]|nr:Putative glycosyltransferase EpsE [Clostridiales bacterium CHKCI001]
MKISVALATYNGEKYLTEQLESLYSQTYQPDEVIVCDDDSTDKTVSIIESFINQYQLQDKWKIFKNEKNRGYANNFYKALSLCHGDIIFFCDQDDIWNCEKIEIMGNLMKQNADIQMLACDYEPYSCTDDAPSLSKEVVARMKNDNTLEKIPLNRRTIFIGSEGCAMCIRRTFRDEIQDYWFSGWAHDEFVWKLSLCEGGCYLYHKNLFKRRLHSNNVSKRKMHTMSKRIYFLENLEKSHQKTLKFAQKLELEEETLQMIKKNIVSVKLRIELMKDKKISNIFPLALRYLNYYSNKKSFLVELAMAIKGDLR